jgi:hypothetical protein
MYNNFIAPESRSKGTEFLSEKMITPTNGVEAFSLSSQPHLSPALPVATHPGIALSILGKRHRDSTTSGIGEGKEDKVSEENFAKATARHTRKRQKQSSRNLETDGNHKEMVVKMTDCEPPRAPSFTVYTGPSPSATTSSSSYADPPPPTEHLPEFYPPPNGHRPVTSTADASENRVRHHSQPNPFNFAFMPLPGTPLYPLTTPRLPFPEQPISPTPAGHVRRGVQLLGIPGRMKSLSEEIMSGSSSDAEWGFINPAALSRPTECDTEQHRLTSHDVATGLGLTAVRTSVSNPTGAEGLSLVKKTMYGTELDSDSRFGDFGVEGIASGFWAGGKFQ